MSGLIDAGKVLQIGCSNFSAKQLEEAEDAATELKVRPFVTVQNEYSLLAREARDEVLPACERLGISFMPYFPLASGMLTGKYRKGEPLPPGSRMAGPGGTESPCDERFELGERLAAFAERHGLAPRARAVVARLATAGRDRDRGRDLAVRDNAAAVEAWKMSDEELAELDELLG